MLLPLESPEGSWGYFLTEEAISARDAYPERFVAFCCVDPRYPSAGEFIRFCAEKRGCKGFGEHVNGLPFDHRLNKRLYAVCDELGMPLDFEISIEYCADEKGLPRLESCLKEFRNVKFVGHGPLFWSAISADDDRNVAYPKGRIKPGGALDRLLSEYENLYADLSAHSGYNAMTRDPDFTLGFIERHWKKLLWGSDIVGVNQRIPQVGWLGSLPVSEEIRKAIGSENARSLLFGEA